MPNAIVLLSGGLDSATALAVAKRDGFNVYALSFRYGQRHEVELAAARRVAERFGVARHVIMEIDLRMFGGSALTSDVPVPKGRLVEEMASGIPITYVPARNTVFLAFALAFAETVSASDIYIGVNAIDYSGYPDCRPEFIDAFEKLANLATRASVEGTTRVQIRTPLLRLAKSEIIELGLALDVDYGLTRSCYDPLADGTSCGECDSCQLRLRGFATVGLQDPAPYVSVAQELR
jgi:7-cyano-7-deazaguanine synthase